jgi:hypothetical protein
MTRMMRIGPKLRRHHAQSIGINHIGVDAFPRVRVGVECGLSAIWSKQIVSCRSSLRTAP